MSSRDAGPNRGWPHRRFSTVKVPKRARVYPDELQLEFLERNLTHDLQQSTQTPSSVGSSWIFPSFDTHFGSFDSSWSSFFDAIMPMILAYLYDIGQRFSRASDIVKSFPAHGRHKFQMPGLVYQGLCFRAISDYLKLLQMVLDVRKALSETYATKMYQSYRDLLPGCLDLSKDGKDILPYDKLDAQPPYLYASQCCFICFALGGDDAKAVQVRIKRPTKHRKIRKWAIDSNVNGGLRSICYKDIQRCDWAVESDTDVYLKIRRASLSACSLWCRFLPFYGIRSVREVEFDFRGGMHYDGSFPIVIHPIDLKSVRDQVDRVISSAAADDDPCHDNACDKDGNWHSDICKSDVARTGGPCIQQLPEPIRSNLQPEYHSLGCQTLTDNYPEPCIQKQAEQAKRRKKKLESLSLLTKCTRYPEEANGEMTLGGMALESCVLETRGDLRVVVPQRNCPYDGLDRIRGLQVTMGWQIAQSPKTIASKFGWTILFTSIIWLCTVWWMRGTRDVSTAMAFGQLVAASVSIAFLTIRH